jgi:hypothetical protein
MSLKFAVIIKFFLVLLYLFVENSKIEAQNNFQFELEYPVRKFSGDAFVTGKGEIICLISERTGTNFGPSNLNKGYLLVFSASGDTTTYNYHLGDTCFNFTKIAESLNGGYMLLGGAKLYETDQTFLMAMEVDSNYQMVWVKFYEFSEYWRAWTSESFTIEDEYIIGFNCCEFPCAGVMSGLMRIDQNGNIIQQYLHNQSMKFQSEFLLEKDSSLIRMFNNYSVNNNLNTYKLTFNMDFDLVSADIFPEVYYFDDVISHNDSTILVTTGYRRSGSTTYNDRDLFVFAYDTSLNLQNQFSIGTQDTLDEPAYLTPLDFRHYDSIFFLGIKNEEVSIGPPTTVSWIMTGQINAELNLRNVQFIGGDTYYNTFYIKATPDGGCFIHADKYIQGSLILNLVFIKLNREGALVWSSEKNIPVKTALVYPNPVEDHLIVECYLDTYTIVLYDVNGKLILNRQAKSGKTTLNTSNVASGFYTLHIYDEKMHLLENKKIVKL